MRKERRARHLACLRVKGAAEPPTLPAYPIPAAFGMTSLTLPHTVVVMARWCADDVPF